MKEERLWADIGPEKTNLLKLYGFEIVGGEFAKRGKSKPWILGFEHVRDTPLAILHSKLSSDSRNRPD